MVFGLHFLKHKPFHDLDNVNYRALWTATAGRLPRLRRLTLDMYNNCDLTDDAFLMADGLSPILPAVHSPVLRELRLRFGNHQFTAAGVKRLVDVLCSGNFPAFAVHALRAPLP